MDIRKTLSSFDSPVVDIHWSIDERKLLVQGELKCAWLNVSDGKKLQEFVFSSPVRFCSLNGKTSEFIVTDFEGKCIAINIETRAQETLVESGMLAAKYFSSSGDIIILCGVDYLSIYNRHNKIEVKFKDFQSIGKYKEVKQIQVYDNKFLLNVGNEIQYFQVIGREIIHVNSFCDPVIKQNYTDCHFWNQGSAASASVASESYLQIWDLNNGNLKDSLNGSSQGSLGFSWHPSLPVLLAVSGNSLHFWENKSGNAPDTFVSGLNWTQINVVYEESETEFDLLSDDEEITLAKPTESTEIDTKTWKTSALHSDLTFFKH